MKTLRNPNPQPQTNLNRRTASLNASPPKKVKVKIIRWKGMNKNEADRIQLYINNKLILNVRANQMCGPHACWGIIEIEKIDKDIEIEEEWW